MSKAKTSSHLFGDFFFKNKSSLFLPLFFYLSFVYSEFVFRIATLEKFAGIGLLYIVLFSLPASLICYGLSIIWPKKVNTAISVVLSFVIAVFYCSQLIYNKVFHTFYTAYSVANGGQAIQFWKEVLSTIGKNIVTMLFLFLPLLFLCTFLRKKISYNRAPITVPISVLLLVLVTHFSSALCTYLTGQDSFSPYDMYFKTISIDYSVENLGMLTTMRLDVQRTLTGFTQQLPDDFPIEDDDLPPEEEELPAPETTAPNTSEETTTEAPEEITYPPNVMQINFDELIQVESDKTIAQMHKYFSQVTPTNQNEKTGTEKGNNLILITAEAFSQYAIDKDLTPTLYKMATEGYQFKNFYTPIWGVSTSDGEYVACQGLIPKGGIWSFQTSAKNYLPFTMGNQLGKLGYSTNAYHNNTYTYYGRDKSHPNMGYTYKGLGNGLDVKKTWPESDLEMMEKSVDEYIGNKPFHAYYMTVSGHLNYTYSGNMMATKNQNAVKDLPYSDAVKAYLACNIELDKAMEYLLQKLEEAGIAENTLIAISADHYPYGLTNEEISELAGHPVEENFELYRNAFILYRKGMTGEVIERPCSSLDIIPTISNLLGLEYDSRLLAGRDMFSDSEPLIIFLNHSWITDKAKYNAKTKEVTSLTDEPVSEEYVKKINKIVNDKFIYSAKILEKDYYRKILK